VTTWAVGKRALDGEGYLVIIVLHEFPIEISVFDPGEIVLNSIPIDPRVQKHVLLVKAAILIFPRDHWLGASV
jgi:hypothetical protein